MDEYTITDERSLLRAENDELRAQLANVTAERDDYRYGYDHAKINNQIDAELLMKRAERLESLLRIERKRHKKEMDELIKTARYHGLMAAVFAAIGGFFVAAMVLAAKIAGLS